VSRRTTKLLAAAAAVLTLAGCASLRPGVAAEVGDERISMDRLNAFADSFCRSGLLAQSGQADTAAATRVASLSFLIRTALATQYAEEYLDTVPQSQVDGFIATTVEPTIESLPEEQREDFLDEVRDFLVATQLAQSAALAQLQATGSELTEQSVGEAVNALWAQWADDAGVELDPRFGTWQDMNIAVSSGSLSVPATDEAPAASGPGSRACGS
jgi:hypothetical protein